MEQNKTLVSIMRAGTSKGIFILSENLPDLKKEREELILKIFGSPDIRQIDGLGGADPLTSKLAIVGPSTNEEADVDYTFGQVSYTNAQIDYSGNCGNISAGVGPFAIDQGLVKVTEPYTIVRINNTNTGKILKEKVEIENGKVKVKGDYSIAGVPGTGSKIEIDFSKTVGAATGKILPTGNVIDKIMTNDLGEIEVSIVDVANPVVFVKAKDLGLKGTETPAEIDGDENTLRIVEEIRGKVCVMMGLVDRWNEAKEKIPAFPMIAMVSSASDYTNFTKGTTIKESEVDFLSRLMFMQITHKTYAGTATICTGAAARITGSVVNQVMEQKGKEDTIKIGHPAGIITVDVKAHLEKKEWILEKAVIGRTARKILEGYCYTVNS